jgi:WhiB family redox-sensing transcriptional regulator
MSDVKRLPGPIAEAWDWQLDALCRGMAVSLFYHPWGERGESRVAREEDAKSICQACPVIAECREHALKVAEPYGVWGGLTEKERDFLLNRNTRSSRRDRDKFMVTLFQERCTEPVREDTQART